MATKLHHVNFCTNDVAAMDAFYRDVLEMREDPTMAPIRARTADGYNGQVAFVTDGATQMHLAERDLNAGFRTGQAINPLERGHIAFRTDDIEGLKKRLAARGVPFSNYGAWAMNGWEQIFFHDPDGNIVEVHQVKG